MRWRIRQLPALQRNPPRAALTRPTLRLQVRSGVQAVVVQHRPAIVRPCRRVVATPMAAVVSKPPALSHGATAMALKDLAWRVSCLHLGHRNPEQFYEKRSDIAEALRVLARGI
jgi:hypothetical protein